MKQFLLRFPPVLVLALMAGCSGMGMFGDGSGNAVSMPESKPAATAPQVKNAASIRITPYADGRNMDNPRKIGIGADFVSGLSGRDILLDRDVAVLVTQAVKRRLDDTGFQISEGQDSNALFELSGVVKELTYNVKARDEVSISIETTLKDAATGKVVWSGIAAETADRFAGVSGNNKKDVADYLRKELGIVTGKTADAISTSLMAARPELFNQTPGAKIIPGVTVLTAPPAGAPVPAVVSAPAAQPVNGWLVINTNPVRAKIYLDEVYYGLSPLRLEMEAGIHTVNAKMEGYKTVSEKVSVRKGDSTELEMKLER